MSSFLQPTSARHNSCSPIPCQHGFTMVELVVVLILIGIISAVAFPRFAGVNDYSSSALRNTIISSQKLAQKTALAQHASSVYWVLSQPSTDNWQVQILLDDDTSDSTVPEDVTPGAVSGAFPAVAAISYSVDLAAGGSVNSSDLAVSDNLVVMYNQLGDMIEVADNISLSTDAGFPKPENSTDEVDSSLQITDSSGDLCLSLTGYAYAATCR